MSRAINPLAPRQSGIQNHLSAIKGWVREALTLHDKATVTVTELACRDEGCPDTETVIGVLEKEQPIRVSRIHKPISQVTRHDVELAVSGSATDPGGA